MQWISEHWEAIATVGGIAVVLISTLLVRLVEFFGDDHPRLRRWCGFFLSLLALARARDGASAGVRLVVGKRELQLPLVSWSEELAVGRIADRVRAARGLR